MVLTMRNYMKNFKLKLSILVAAATLLSAEAAPRSFAAGTPPITKIVTILKSCLNDFEHEHAQRKFHTYIDEILEIIVKEQDELMNEITPSPKWPDKRAFLLELARKLEAIKHEKDWKVVDKALNDYFAYVSALKKEFEANGWGEKIALLNKFKKRLQI